MNLDKVREVAERVARSEGAELVDIEWKVGRQRFLRITIDKPEGISHRECEAVSKQVSVILDVEDLVPGPGYVLEVSSPGMDRKLVKASEYEHFKGRLARISLAEPVENSSFYEGRLAGCSEGVVSLDVNGRMVSLPFAAIRKAHLVVEL
jgi:ribosome maturation factor RimP